MDIGPGSQVIGGLDDAGAARSNANSSELDIPIGKFQRAQTQRREQIAQVSRCSRIAQERPHPKDFLHRANKRTVRVIVRIDVASPTRER